MIGSETTADYAITAIKTFLNDQLVELTPEGMPATPVPTDVLFGDLPLDILPDFPIICVEAYTLNDKDDQAEFNEFSYLIRVVGWVCEIDTQILQRIVNRYADAIVFVLRNADNWGSGVHSPVIEGVSYSDVYTSDSNLVKGCRVDISIKEIY